MRRLQKKIYICLQGRNKKIKRVLYRCLRKTKRIANKNVRNIHGRQEFQLFGCPERICEGGRPNRLKFHCRIRLTVPSPNQVA